MNKKLLAVAVAGALAAPGVAFAQASSVTISGFFKLGIESISMSGTPSDTRLNTSEMRMVDSASRIVFNSTEGLGNGMSGIMQLDLRVNPQLDGGVGPGGVGLDGGNTYVGLKSDSWGQLTFGRQDLHYMVATMPVDNTASIAGPLQAVNTSIIDYIGPFSAGVGSQKEVVKWASPNWSGFSAVVGWSANAYGQSADMTAYPLGIPAGTSTRRGDAWNIAPQYVNGPLGIGYSYWRSKPDAPVVGSLDERADTLWGYYTFGAFKIGVGFNRIKFENSVGGGLAAERDAWTIPMSYTFGPHNIAGHYSVARDLESAAGDENDTGARMIAIAYSYSLSKRTSVGLTYAKINNDKNINYNFFTGAGFGSADAAPMAGESPRMIQATINHSF